MERLAMNTLSRTIEASEEQLKEAVCTECGVEYIEHPDWPEGAPSLCNNCCW